MDDPSVLSLVLDYFGCNESHTKFKAMKLMASSMMTIIAIVVYTVRSGILT
jgi:hypothetical protein